MSIKYIYNFHQTKYTDTATYNFFGFQNYISTTTTCTSSTTNYYYFFCYYNYFFSYYYYYI